MAEMLRRYQADYVFGIVEERQRRRCLPAANARLGASGKVGLLFCDRP